MSDLALPLGLRRRSDSEAIREDIEPYQGTSLEERSRITHDLSRLAAEQAAAHPERERILAYQEPRSAESLALWLRLVREHRGGK